jgi:hypothetical protein
VRGAGGVGRGKDDAYEGCWQGAGTVHGFVSVGGSGNQQSTRTAANRGMNYLQLGQSRPVRPDSAWEASYWQLGDLQS